MIYKIWGLGGGAISNITLFFFIYFLRKYRTNITFYFHYFIVSYKKLPYIYPYSLKTKNEQTLTKKIIY